MALTSALEPGEVWFEGGRIFISDGDVGERIEVVDDIIEVNVVIGSDISWGRGGVEWGEA